jgi:hypothetical protein
MARIINLWRALRKHPAVYVLEVLLYAAMLALILISFSGHGQFIYEGF